MAYNVNFVLAPLSFGEGPGERFIKDGKSVIQTAYTKNSCSLSGCLYKIEFYFSLYLYYPCWRERIARVYNNRTKQKQPKRLLLLLP
jgi:hypothetical protein